MKKHFPLFSGLKTPASGSPARNSPSFGAGDATRFQDEILPHIDAAFNLARYLTRDPVLSEDVVQDAFVRAFRGFDRFRGNSPKAWLLAIVRNCSRSAITAAGERSFNTVNESTLGDAESLDLQQRPDPAMDPEQQLIRKDEADIVRRAIQAIPEPFREAVVLRDIEGLSYSEISEVSAVAIGTVMSRISRGRSMLADALLPGGSEQNQRSRSAK